MELVKSQPLLTFGCNMRKMNRVCIFIDNSNLFWAIKSLKEKAQRLNYVKLKERLADGRDADVRFYYSMPSRPQNLYSEAMQQYEKLTKFYIGIRELGYQMVGLPLRERTVFSPNGRTTVPREKGLDCEIVYDMATLSRTGDYHAFVLVAGDEDYARTVRRVRQEVGIRVDVAFFSHAGCSNVLVKEASEFLDLSQEIDSLFRESKPKHYFVA